MGEEEIEITILGDAKSSLGAEFTKERREPLQVNIVPITQQNVDRYFPDYRKTHSGRFDEDMRNLDEGKSYWCVATHPETGNKVGLATVNCVQDNLFGLGVDEEYQRRGVTKQIVQHLQGKFDHLSLDNHAGRVGEEFYGKMGFEATDMPKRMIWRKED